MKILAGRMFHRITFVCWLALNFWLFDIQTFPLHLAVIGSVGAFLMFAGDLIVMAITRKKPPMNEYRDADGWVATETALPPEGAIVEAKDSSGRVAKLKLRGNLWFFPDDSMYVYYTPQFWRFI